MYDKTSIRILEQIYINEDMHKRGLSKILKLGMPSIEHALRKMEKILIKKKIGNQLRYSLDYSRPALAPLLAIIELNRFERLPSKIKIAVREFLSELEQKPAIAILFGSYARGDYNQDSDIDIFLVTGSTENIEKIAKRVGMRTNTRINPVFLKFSHFRSSFHDPTKVFFKKLRKDKIILEGIEWFRGLIDEET